MNELENHDPALARLLAETAPPTDDAGLVVARAMARIRRPAAPWWQVRWVTPWRAGLAGLAVAGVLLGLFLPLPGNDAPPPPDGLLALLSGDGPGLPL